MCRIPPYTLGDKLKCLSYCRCWATASVLTEHHSSKRYSLVVFWRAPLKASLKKIFRVFSLIEVLWLRRLQRLVHVVFHSQWPLVLCVEASDLIMCFPSFHSPLISHPTFSAALELGYSRFVFVVLVSNYSPCAKLWMMSRIIQIHTTVDAAFPACVLCFCCSLLKKDSNTLRLDLIEFVFWGFKHSNMTEVDLIDLYSKLNLQQNEKHISRSNRALHGGLNPEYWKIEKTLVNSSVNKKIVHLVHQQNTCRDLFASCFINRFLT